ncbi:DDRGK domain-containing protein 1 [Dermatophagoides pteronyssinus]|uniref:DDRGK domain-containing protein 1 n=1 Tax=Dermatophagoides pteronyssinus TaxID=6956 RepID=A0ABQ8J465_DERPT|nr:DDRGK domain-containing protein 1 [Dermatophagoides pteronyssinus]
MDLVYLITLLTSFFFVLIVILIAVKGLKNSQNDGDDDNRNEQRQSNRRLRPPGESGLRNRLRTNRQTINPDDDDEELEEIDFDDDNEGVGDDDGEDGMKEFPIKGKIGAKKARKLEMKAEKKLARERELQEREERKRMLEEQEKQRKLEEERIAAEEKAKEEAERLEKERKAREEQELYLQMKKQFTIDDEGYDGDENEEESQNKLQVFIDYIKEKKVVHMDELAGNFNMKTSDVVQRINGLLEQELLIGVIDDRGKFIYITNDELESVARFIKQRGRISLMELAENSNNLIKLIPVEATS